ncbi:hypothetical protein SAMN02745945_01504 [Peptoclostridium litorale DSM 5388]|uniref:Uncharacterized protein n=1 Tax=Peptoclostridium litorale DSM 5388 TaxID=1121324 RepID=A0A069RFU9_PEPLI|nr:hypothetical protein [Peptoclostridium litorale]KDR95653.1 hypothetical protein CLIT_10c03800 [Peptoclostridium litorale DSM 5388]SIO00328.1 hypothetical protein SAMN02745945_01504 [Peptoclostridium litorale DSM 5388]
MGKTMNLPPFYLSITEIEIKKNRLRIDIMKDLKIAKFRMKELERN